jgi:hypothetical protein
MDLLEKSIGTAILMMLPFSSYATSFKSLSFDFKKDMKCSQTEDSMYCINEKKNIILNLTIKERASSDSLMTYKKHLSKNIAKTINYRSKLKSVEKIYLSDRAWIISNHYESEYPSFFTQYYASVKGKNAYLLSISYKEGKLSDKELEKFSKTLKF